LNADTIKYTTLDPPIPASGVTNPMSAVLQCNGNDIGAVGAQAAGGLFCNTLHYTTLNPPINPGVVNPLAADLTCTGFSVLDATSMTSGTATITSTLNCNTVNGIFGGLEQLAVFATTGTGNGNVTASGDVSANKVVAGSGGLEVQSGPLDVGSGGRTTLNGGFDIPLGPAQNLINNKIHFFNEVKMTGLEDGSYGIPTPLYAAGNPLYKVVTLPADKYTLDLVCLAVPGAAAQVLFDINTPLTNLLTDYFVEATAYCIDNKGITPPPEFSKLTFSPALVTTATGNIGVQMFFNNVDGAGTQVFRVRVKISFPS